MKEYFIQLAATYNMSLANVLAIAVNRYGIVMKDTDEKRLRFNLQFVGTEKPSYFAVCVNTYLDSPFSLEGDTLFLDNEVIGKVSGIERDTCTATYFRNDKKVITLNSNSRSQCKGCKFCGTYNLSEDDNWDFSTPQMVQGYFDQLLAENQMRDMQRIENVTVCTGCFPSEQHLYDHMMTLHEAFKKMGFNGSINYIGSQLRSYDKIKELKDTIGDFGIYLTLEMFQNREKFMRKEKASLTLPEAHDLLAYASSIDVTSTFLYILGLEPLPVIEENFAYFKDAVNKYPIVQVFQDYTPDQEQYRILEAKDIEYYIKARFIIEKIFGDTNLAPKVWESFRSLYTEDTGVSRKRAV